MEYNLIFKGEVEQGFDISVTKRKLASAFKASDEKVEALFSGRPTIIKKGLTFESGVKLQQQLLNIGAKTELELSDIKQSPPVSRKPSVRIPPVAPARPASKVALALQPVQQVATPIEPEPQTEVEEKTSKFSFQQIALSMRRTFAVVLLLLGIACLVVYSPFEDQVIRIGFLLGGLLVFLSYRKLKQW